MVVEDVHTTIPIPVSLLLYEGPTIEMEPLAHRVLPSSRRTLVLPETKEYEPPLTGDVALLRSVQAQQDYQERATRHDFVCIAFACVTAWVMGWLAVQWATWVFLNYLHLV